MSAFHISSVHSSLSYFFSFIHVLSWRSGIKKYIWKFLSNFYIWVWFSASCISSADRCNSYGTCISNSKRVKWDLSWHKTRHNENSWGNPASYCIAYSVSCVYINIFLHIHKPFEILKGVFLTICTDCHQITLMNERENALKESSSHRRIFKLYYNIIFKS